MKRLLKLAAILLLMSTVSYPKAHCKGPLADSNAVNAIVHELQQIKAIHDSTYQQRLRAAEKRMHDTNSRQDQKQDYELSEYGLMSNIEKYTKPSFLGDDVNMIGLIAQAIALVSLAITYITLRAQRKTEKNTKKAPISVQQGILKDLPRHFYRNLVCTCSQILLYYDDSNKDSSGRRLRYPSEANMLKLQTMPDDIILPINTTDNVYQTMHELRFLFRNYSQEVAVAANHISKANITEASLYQDFDNLLFKPMFLTRKTFDLAALLEEKDIKDYSATLFDRARAIMIGEHFSKLKDNGFYLLDQNRTKFLKTLLDDNFQGLKKLDTQRAISRSMRFFFYELHPNGKKTPVIINNRTLANEFETNIRNICSKDDLYALFNKYHMFINPQDQTDIRTNPEEAELRIRQLYDTLKPYFEMLRADSCEFETLFMYMLSIDTAIETAKTGMVNY